MRHPAIKPLKDLRLLLLGNARPGVADMRNRKHRIRRRGKDNRPAMAGVFHCIVHKVQDCLLRPFGVKDGLCVRRLNGD